MIKKQKAYITCPVSHSNDRLALLPTIKKAVESRGIEAFVFKIGGTPEEIFQRDYSELQKSTILIAEVSERSHGVGIEIGLSYALGLRRILIFERGNFVTKLAQGMPLTTLIEYVDKNDLLVQLSKVLDS